MRITSLAFLALWGVVSGCSPQGTVMSEPTKAEGESPGASALSKRTESESESEIDLFQGTRSSRGKQTQARSAPPARLARPAEPSSDETEVEDAEWTMSIRPDGTLVIRHKGATVVWAKHETWGDTKVIRSGQWEITRFKAEPASGGQFILNGSVTKLDLEAKGSIRRLSDHEFGFDYRFRAAKGHSGIYGTTLDWKFDLKSPSFEGRVAADPVLLDDKTGWTWKVGPNQAITVRFDRPLDKVIFEAKQKNNIRTFFFADHFGPGERRLRYTASLPEGGRVSPSPEERYGPADTKGWYVDALRWDASPVDLSFLNAKESPAGIHGLLKADGNRVVFEDGTPARFWGANLCAYALFSTPRENIARQAHRMAQLGYNLMRIMHHDSWWVKPNIFADNGLHDTRRLNPQSLELLDWWIKCLKDEGVYVWLDLSFGRELKPGDGVTNGFEEIARNHGYVSGFNYFNEDVQKLMIEFQRQLLTHVNKYTRLAYKDDPGIVAVLITNENDLTFHFGNLMQPNHNNPVHNAQFKRDIRAFAEQTGLPESRLWITWEPGPSKVFLNAMEHRFNSKMIADLRDLGVRVPLVTTNFWSECSLFNLPSLTEGDIVDVHSYGVGEELSRNPRYEPNFISGIAAARVEGKPFSITEWGVASPITDRFTAPLYVASIAALQGWDMPMIYCYSQNPLKAPRAPGWESKTNQWSLYNDPEICGVMPAAAMAFRQGHISPARTNYCLMLSRDQLFDQALNAKTAAALRTIVEQSRFSVGLPAVKELGWLKPTETPSGATIINDPYHDFIPAGQSFVRSDTGELLRNWKYGIQSIDSPKTQSVSGWIGGKLLKTKDATFQFSTKKAIVVLTSMDGRPLSSSGHILITTMGRALASNTNEVPYFSEPIVGSITLKTKTTGLELLALSSTGSVQERLKPQSSPDGLTVRLPTHRGTHWYVLKTGEPSKREVAPTAKSSK